MNTEQFNELLERKLADSRTVLAGKAEEYSHGGDRLSNFKCAATILNCTPEKALLGFVTKHITALYDFVDALPDGRQYTVEQWAEKTGDIRNYMILLDGLIEERLAVADVPTIKVCINCERPYGDMLSPPSICCGGYGYKLIPA